MSRKQEIYKEILAWALPTARNTFSWFRQVRLVVVLSPKLQRCLAAQYVTAEFVHNLYVSILDEEFTDHDIYFLNYQARLYFERGDEDYDPNYYHFVYRIQELFAEVPADKRDKLLWNGPEGDYSWAQPRRGAEWTPELEREWRDKARLARAAKRQGKSKLNSSRAKRP